MTSYYKARMLEGACIFCFVDLKMTSANLVKSRSAIRHLLSSIWVKAFTAVLPAFFLAPFEEGADIFVVSAKPCPQFCTASMSHIVTFVVPDL